MKNKRPKSYMEYGQFYRYLQNPPSQSNSLFKKSGNIVRNDLMRERKERKDLLIKKNEKEKERSGNIELSPEKMYMIDKVVRKKLQEKTNDIDYSELLDPILDEAKEPSSIAGRSQEAIGKEESKRLPQQENPEKNESLNGMSFEEWCRRKDVEDKLKQHLIQIETEEYLKQEMEKDQEKQEYEEQKKEILQEWESRKREELLMKKQMEKQKKMEIEEEKREKKRNGERAYQEWLENSILKMQEEQIKKLQEINERKVLALEKKRDKDRNKERSEKSYANWLREKQKLMRMEKKKEQMQHQTEYNPYLESFNAETLPLGTKPSKKRRMKKKKRIAKTCKPLIESFEVSERGEEEEFPQEICVVSKAKDNIDKILEQKLREKIGYEKEESVQDNKVDIDEEEEEGEEEEGEEGEEEREEEEEENY